ncbi:MAG: phytanoyl-CoA dioxygenase family protein [Phycisphaeraceae bacterium]
MPASPEPTVSLTPEQIAFFNEEGYLSIDALTTPEEVERLREIYDQLFDQQAGREEGNQFDLAGPDEDGQAAALPQILNPAKYAPALNDTLLLVNARSIGQQLLGEQAKAHFAHAIYKPARSGAATPWHQDAAYWNPGLHYRTLSIWVPLQPATIENGCMHFVPRSHEGEIVPHQSINNDPRVHGLELRPDQLHLTENAVACPLGPGGATVHGGYMMHYAPANRSEIPRRALILSAAAPATPRDEPLRFPWIEEKRTARSERAKRAAEATG